VGVPAQDRPARIRLDCVGGMDGKDAEAAGQKCVHKIK
jgi:hypothetical protein